MQSQKFALKSSISSPELPAESTDISGICRNKIQINKQATKNEKNYESLITRKPIKSTNSLTENERDIEAITKEINSMLII